MERLSVAIGNIVDDAFLAKADAIVLPTNPMMRCGAGVSGAIFRKAGVEQLERYAKETFGVSYEDLTRKNEMRPGEVRITPGFALPCDIIFAQGPKAYAYANYDEALSLLLLTYKNTLKVAAKQGYRIILLPALGTGSYSFLHEDTAELVMRLLLDELRLYDLSVILVIYEKSVAPLYTRWLKAEQGGNNMNEETISRLHQQWKRTACDGMGDCLLGEAAFLELAKETFRLLSSLDSNQSISNPIACILVLMQEFAVYCWFSENDPHLRRWTIVSNVLYDFLEGFEQCGSVYPKLKLADAYNMDFFDFETNTLADIEICSEVPF